MAGFLILVVSGLYVLTALSLVLKGNIGLAIAFGGYAVANVGLWMAS